jgi:hypothetical protein
MMGQNDPSYLQASYYDPTQAPIMEQMAEYEDETAGRPLPPALTNLEQRSQHSQGSQ